MAILGLNLSSQTATYFLSSANTGLNRAISRLSSGSNFALAGDKTGATTAAIVKQTAERLGTVLEGVQALSQFQTTADSYASSVQDALNSLRELTSRAESAAYSNSERAAFNADYQAILTQTQTMIADAQYAGSTVIANGGGVQATSLGGTSNFSLDTMDASTDIASVTGTSITTTALATAARLAIDTAQVAFDTDRSGVLANISTLAAISAGITVEKSGRENTLALLQDVDFAKESTMLAKQNILVQSATAMLAQANSAQQNVLALLR